MSNSESSRIIDGSETEPGGIYGSGPVRKLFLVDSHMNYIAIQCQNFDYRKFIFRNDGAEISGCESRRNGPGVIPRNGRAQKLAHKVSLTTLLDGLSHLFQRTI